MMSDQSGKTELLGDQPVRRDSMQCIIARGEVFHAFLCVLVALGCFVNLEILPSDKGFFFSFFSALPGNGRLPEIISVTVLLYIVSRYCCKDHAWRNHRLVKCLVSLFFSLTMVFGWAFAFHNSAYLLFLDGVQCCKTLFSLAAWFSVSYLCLSALLKALPSLHEHFCNVSNQSLLSKIGAVFHKHPLLYASVALNVIWFPALIGYFPGLFTWDTPQQIYMWFNMPNYHSSLLRTLSIPK